MAEYCSSFTTLLRNNAKRYDDRIKFGNDHDTDDRDRPGRATIGFKIHELLFGAL